MRLSIFAILISIVAACPAATLTGVVTGYVSPSNANGPAVIFKMNTSTVEGCNSTGRFAMSSQDVRYKANLTAIMAAYHSQSPVTATYNTTCTTWGNSYDLTYVCVGTVGC